jgi:methyl-accepting chemotaxis protein
MKLETKLGASTGTLILSMLISAFVAQISIQETNRLSATLTEERLPLIRLTRDARFAPQLSVRSLESYLIFADDPESAARFRAERRENLAHGDAAASQLHNLIRQYNLDAEAAPLQVFEAANANLITTEDEAERISDRHTPESTRQAIALLQDQILPQDAALFASLHNFVRSEEALRDDEVGRLRSANSAVLITLWTATIVCAIIGGFISILFAGRITRGIGLLADRAHDIASGDLTGPTLNIGPSDQVSSLANAIQQMQSSLGNIIRTVADTARSLSASAISMSSSTDHIHRRVEQQTEQTQQAATSMQEMSASIGEVSRHTRSAAETARSAAETAREGGAIVRQMLGAMHSIATAVSDTSSTIGLLGDDSHRISQIVTVIDEIATKTNLLALNAAIEAARAGEHGRGFAVVAGEVRHLAESTARATGEISAMIREIQERTRTAIASMASGTVTVQQGVATTNQAGEALERIIGIAEQVDRMIAQIAIAASQQAASADQSSSSLDSIHALSLDNLSEMSSTAASIESLRATAAALESQVERFRIDLPSERVSTSAGRQVGAKQNPQAWLADSVDSLTC